jgi:hypothetical protein
VASLGGSGHDGVDCRDPAVDVGELGGGHLDAGVGVRDFHIVGAGRQGSLADVTGHELAVDANRVYAGHGHY